MHLLSGQHNEWNLKPPLVRTKIRYDDTDSNNNFPSFDTKSSGGLVVCSSVCFAYELYRKNEDDAAVTARPPWESKPFGRPCYPSVLHTKIKRTSGQLPPPLWASEPSDGGLLVERSLFRLHRLGMHGLRRMRVYI